MANQVSSEIIGNMVKVEFSTAVTPIFPEKKNKDYILYGADNNYPAFVLSLYKDHAEHGAIVKSKAKYLYGRGLSINPKKGSVIEQAKAQNFLMNANRFTDWNHVFKKTCKSYELFNGWAWQIVWSIGQNSFEIFPLKFSNVRISKCKTKAYYCDAWTKDDGKPNTQPENHPSFKCYPLFDGISKSGTQIFYYKEFEEAAEVHGSVYPLPEYAQCNLQIATDIAISEFQNALVENGMSAQGMLTLFSGAPTDEGKRKIERLFESKFTGPRKAGKIIFNFANPDASKGAEYTSLTTTDLDKQFELILKTNQQKIFTGHQVTNKQLFGVSQEGALSDRTTLDISYKQMQNTYTIPRQDTILEEMQVLADMVGVNLNCVEVQQLSPIDVDFLDPNVSKYLTEDEIREKLGLEPKKSVSTQQASNEPVQVNEHLKNLTGRQWQGIQRIKKKCSQGLISRAEAEMMLKSGYGLGAEEVNIILQGQQFTSDVDPILLAFESLAENENDDEIVSEEFVTFRSSQDATNFEFIQHETFKASDKLQNEVLSILQGEPTASPDKIAKQLGEDVDMVNEAIAALIAANLVVRGIKSLNPTPKGVEKTVKPVEVEVYTVYKYVTRPNVPRAKQTRPFCEKLLALTEAGKVWTRDAIDSISNDYKQDAWIYRGGFYTNPQSNETTPYCRHIWKAVTKTRVKK